MATKLTLGTHAISALMRQAERFGMMSVYHANSADLATAQAKEIAIWTSKLIDAVTRIRQEAEDAAATSRKYVQDKILMLKTQADSSKRKILDTSVLDSLQTIKANFRLIFGPPRETEKKSKSTKSVMATNLIRINTIRGLCESNSYGVIALSTTYPTKVWTESSPEVFDGIIKLIKDETEQDWPEEIVDIMDELETERLMSVEFRILRAKISQRQCRRRQRMGYSDGAAREIEPLPPMQTGELATQIPLSGQYPSGMTQLPSLQQMALIAPSSNRDQTQSWGYRQDSTTDSGYNGTFVDEQRQRPLLCESAHHPSRQYEQENSAPVDSLPPSKENREMKHMYTNAPASNISKLPEPFRTAVQNSRLWKWERSQEPELETTGCWASLFPKGYTQDVSFTIWCGHDDAYRLNDVFGVRRAIPSQD